MNYKKIIDGQKKLCAKYNVQWVESSPDTLIGMMKNLGSGIMPLNGLRHPIEKGTAGWYLWAGKEWMIDTENWDPIHISHLDDVVPLVLKYLGLPPGYRFLVDDKGYEDVWEDKKLLDI